MSTAAFFTTAVRSQSIDESFPGFSEERSIRTKVGTCWNSTIWDVAGESFCVMCIFCYILFICSYFFYFSYYSICEAVRPMIVKCYHIAIYILHRIIGINSWTLSICLAVNAPKWGRQISAWKNCATSCKTCEYFGKPHRNGTRPNRSLSGPAKEHVVKYKRVKAVKTYLSFRFVWRSLDWQRDIDLFGCIIHFHVLISVDPMRISLNILWTLTGSRKEVAPIACFGMHCRLTATGLCSVFQVVLVASCIMAWFTFSSPIAIERRIIGWISATWLSGALSLPMVFTNQR